MAQQTQTKNLPPLPATNTDFWEGAETRLVDMDKKDLVSLNIDSIKDLRVDLNRREIYSESTGIGFKFRTHEVEVKDGYLYLPLRDKTVKVKLDR